MAKPPHDPFIQLPELMELLGHHCPDQLDMLQELMEEDGVDKDSLHVAVFPSGVLPGGHTEAICDGNSVYKICKANGWRPPKPKKHHFKTIDECKQWMKRRIAARHHWSEQSVEKERRNFRDRINELAAQKLSNPEIAKRLGVSNGVVRNARAKETKRRSKGGTAMPPKGVSNRRKKPNNNHLFDGKSATEHHASYVDIPQITPVDAPELPAKSRHAFGDPTLRRCWAMANAVNEAICGDKLIDAVKRKGHSYPFLKFLELAGRLQEVQQTCDKIIDLLKDGMPVALCPECKGAGCETCRKNGVLPINQHDAVTKGAKG